MLPGNGTVFEVTRFARFQYLELSYAHTKPDVPHGCWELIYVDKGKVSIHLDGGEQCIESGNAFLLQPGQNNSIHVDDNLAANVHCIAFELGQGDPSSLAGKLFPVTAEQRGYIKIILKEAKFAYQNDLRNSDYPDLIPSADPPLGCVQMMKNLTEQLLISLMRQSQSEPSKSYTELARENLLMTSMGANPYFDNLIHYLEQNIDKQLTIEQICKDNYTNRSKIQKVFKACAMEGVISFHQKLKIEYAKVMIRETNMNFTQISEALGFSSVHHFSKKFKQLVKMSPSDYSRFAK